MKNKDIGRWGEEIAAAYLIRKGFSIIDKNYFTPDGEIDLIALQVDNQEQTLVFVEVKTRTNEKYGYPEEAITKKKWNHMIKAIEDYFQHQPEHEDNWQIDVIAILRLKEDQPPEIEHFENIVMDYDRE